jgi:hypothetical protein
MIKLWIMLAVDAHFLVVHFIFWLWILFSDCEFMGRVEGYNKDLL